MRATRRPPRQLNQNGRVYRGLRKWLGPATLGDPNEAPPAPLPEANCSLCGRPWSQHTYVQTAQRKKYHCP
jgi:hypothetical protein